MRGIGRRHQHRAPRIGPPRSPYPRRRPQTLFRKYRSALRRSAGVFSGRKELAPALRNDRSLHDLALVGRKVLQADLAAPRTLWVSLIVGVRLFDLVGLLYFLIRKGLREDAAGKKDANGKTSASQQTAAHLATS